MSLPNELTLWYRRVASGAQFGLLPDTRLANSVTMSRVLNLRMLLALLHAGWAIANIFHWESYVAILRSHNGPTAESASMANRSDDTHCVPAS